MVFSTFKSKRNSFAQVFSLNIFYFNKCHFYTDLIYTYSIGLERKLTLIWFFSLLYFCPRLIIYIYIYYFMSEVHTRKINTGQKKRDATVWFLFFFFFENVPIHLTGVKIFSVNRLIHTANIF